MTDEEIICTWMDLKPGIHENEEALDRDCYWWQFGTTGYESGDAPMAALDRDFPVAYVESIDYNVIPATIEEMQPQGEIVHFWLRGGADAQ